MFQYIQDVLLASGLGIITSRTNLLEWLKVSLLVRNPKSKLAYLLDCPLCSAFWSGMILGFLSLDIGYAIRVGVVAGLLNWTLTRNEK